MQSERVFRPWIALLSVAALAAGCAGGKSADANRLAETEPNDAPNQATSVTRNWSTIHLGGTCDTASDADWWAVTFATFVSPAPLTATLGWTGAGAGSLDINLFDALGRPLSTDGATSPAVATTTLTTNGSILLEIKCNAAAGALWKLDIPAPGSNPGEP